MIMAYYRAIKDNTIQIEAEKNDGSRTSFNNIRSLISVAGENNLASLKGGRVIITTRKGSMIVPRGYYVVKDSTEDVFVSSPSDFTAIYEAGVATATSTETSVSSLLANADNWDEAYGWGDHSLAGYASSGDIYGGWQLYVENVDQGVVGSSISTSDYVNFVGGTGINISHSTGETPDKIY